MHTVSIRYQLDRISAAAATVNAADDLSDGSGKGVTLTDTPGTVRPDQLRRVDQTDRPATTKRRTAPARPERQRGGFFVPIFATKDQKRAGTALFAF